MIDFSDFSRIDIRVGTILHGRNFPEARNPAYQLVIDFGSLGVKQSSAQITGRYGLTDLKGRQVLAVVNLPPKRIAGFKSEVLVLGACPDEGGVVLLKPDSGTVNGTRVS